MSFIFQGILSEGDKKNLNLEWETEILSRNMSGPPYEVLHAQDDTYHYFKPCGQYKKIEFEQLFKFIMGGDDFDEERIVKYIIVKT